MVVLRGKCEGLMACHLSVKSVSRQQLTNAGFEPAASVKYWFSQANQHRIGVTRLQSNKQSLQCCIESIVVLRESKNQVRPSRESKATKASSISLPFCRVDSMLCFACYRIKRGLPQVNDQVSQISVSRVCQCVICRDLPFSITATSSHCNSLIN